MLISFLQINITKFKMSIMAHHFKYFIYEKDKSIENLRKNYSWEDSPKHLVLKSLVETDP